MITTSCAFEGPLLVTLRVNVTEAPGAAAAGDADFVNVTSAAVATGAVSVAASLARSGSGVAEVTVAVFERAPVKEASSVPETVIVTGVVPGSSAPRSQVTTPDRSVHVPAEVVAIGLRTAGLTGSVTTVSRAVEGPLSRTVMVNLRGSPGTGGSGVTVLVMARSASAPRTVVAEARLLSGSGSVVAEVTVAVFVKSGPVTSWPTAPVILTTRSWPAASDG